MKKIKFELYKEKVFHFVSLKKCKLIKLIKFANFFANLGNVKTLQ